MTSKPFNHQSKDYILIETAIEYMASNAHYQPTLAQVSSHLGLSEFHLQKLFSRWAGISPKRFLQFLTKEHVKQQLLNDSIENVAFDSGLSTKSRVYDLLVSCEGMTPGEYKKMGKGITIRYGCHDTPFGTCLLALTEKGICKLAFTDRDNDISSLTAELKTEWGLANLIEDQARTENYIDAIFSLSTTKQPLHLVLKGTNFQLKVWEALLSIAPGEVTTYEKVATNLCNPKAVRAVGSAIGKNPVAFLIPCHRVIRKTGELSQYRWGANRKRAIFGWEQAKVRTPPH